MNTNQTMKHLFTLKSGFSTSSSLSSLGLVLVCYEVFSGVSYLVDSLISLSSPASFRLVTGKSFPLGALSLS